VDNDLNSQLLDATRPLLRQLAKLLAAELAPLLLARALTPPESSPRRLLSVDELVALLPSGKKPATWKAWLYQRTRLGQVPGCHKLGNRLFFDPDQTLPWLTDGAATRQTAAGLDLPADQSLHGPPMPHEPTQAPRQGGQR
jgi:hypothetical protein